MGFALPRRASLPITLFSALILIGISQLTTIHHATVQTDNGSSKESQLYLAQTQIPITTSASNTTAEIPQQRSPPAQDSGATGALRRQDERIQQIPPAPAPTMAPTTPKQAARFGIITGLSDNHAIESVSFFQNLIQVNYQGPIWVHYLLFTTDKITQEGKVTRRLEMLKQLVLDSSLNNVTFVVHEDTDGARLYCWKPKIVHNVLQAHQNELNVIMWADVSTRFDINPQVSANNMLTDGIDFSGRTGLMGMGENTHEATYQWLHLERDNFTRYKEVAGTQFLVHLESQKMKSLLEEWFQCARACTECMSPIGSTKDHGKRKPRGPPSSKYIAHRQDQSVLGLLVYRTRMLSAAKIDLFTNSRYFRMQTQRLKLDRKTARMPINKYWEQTAAAAQACNTTTWYQCFL